MKRILLLTSLLIAGNILSIDVNEDQKALNSKKADAQKPARFISPAEKAEKEKQQLWANGKSNLFRGAINFVLLRIATEGVYSYWAKKKNSYSTVKLNKYGRMGHIPGSIQMGVGAYQLFQYNRENISNGFKKFVGWFTPKF